MPEILWVTPVNPVKQSSQLELVSDTIPSFADRPYKPALLEPLGVERHADVIMPDDLDQVADTIPKTNSSRHAERTSDPVEPSARTLRHRCDP